MNSALPVPDSLHEAASALRFARARPLSMLAHRDFVRAWCALAYLRPGIHPDDLHDTDNGWPRSIRRFVAEVWRRAEAGMLSDDELYPSDATWAGLYDRMRSHTPEEQALRALIASGGR